MAGEIRGKSRELNISDTLGTSTFVELTAGDMHFSKAHSPARGGQLTRKNVRERLCGSKNGAPVDQAPPVRAGMLKTGLTAQPPFSATKRELSQPVPAASAWLPRRSARSRRFPGDTF